MIDYYKEAYSLAIEKVVAEKGRFQQIWKIRSIGTLKRIIQTDQTGAK
jgi:hypothetical protein